MIKPIALVTGGTGFIGSHLIKHLVNEGWMIHLVVRPQSDLRALGLTIQEIKIHIHNGSTESLIRILADSKPQIVFHLAALVIAEHTQEDVVPILQSNLIFSVQLLEAMAVNGVSNIINTGTFWQYYEKKDYSPTCFYAATKQAFESILQFYVEARLFKAITLILFDSYGPCDDRPKLFSVLNDARKLNKVISMSPGDQKIDLVHIFDIVEAYLVAALRLLNNKIAQHCHYKVSSGTLISLKDLIGIYEMTLNTKLRINWGGRPYREREVMIPWSLGNSLPDWKPKISLPEGIKTLNH